MRAAGARLREAGGAAFFISDDGYLVGPQDQVFAAFRTLERDLREECGLLIQVTKCELYSHAAVLPADCPPGVSLAGAMLEERFEPGFVVVGVPVGTDNYVTGTLSKKLDSLEAEVTRAINLLGGEPHVLWTILRSSVIHKLEYWLGSVHPSLMAASAARMDALFLESSGGFGRFRHPSFWA